MAGDPFPGDERTVTMEIEKIEQLIKAGIPDAQVKVTGDGRHFEAEVISAEFEGKGLLQRHRLVLATVKEQIETDELHALSIVKAKTPSEV